MAKRQFISSCEIANKVVRRLLDRGWTIHTGGRHKRIVAPDGGMKLTLSITPSDPRATKNWISQIRRQGVPADVFAGL
jgi:predicted RNA binding protein YcfA (HicA-like mRNA interferase family)